VTLAPEGGAHQSTITASIGLELPGLTLIEPAFASTVEWLLCDALARIARNPSGLLPADEQDEPTSAYYFRLSTRPIDPAPFEAARARLGDRVLRSQAITGAYRLVDAGDPSSRPVVNLAGSGAVLPEVVAAAELLAADGVAAHVVDVTSQSRLHAAWQRSVRTAVRNATVRDRPGTLHAPFAAGRPLVTVQDASSHTMAWLGSALGVPSISLGVDDFGQSGTIDDLYRIHGLDAESIATAALATLQG